MFLRVLKKILTYKNCLKGTFPVSSSILLLVLKSYNLTNRDKLMKGYD